MDELFHPCLNPGLRDWVANATISDTA